MASESEEMGSLFEGMILFNPSASGADAEKSMLDENLFSDLTLMTQLQDEEDDDDEVTLPPSDLPPAAVSRQNSTSRRRKKAAALRIGYGRDRDFSIEIPEQESSVPSSITGAEEQDNDDTDAAVLNHVKEDPVELKFEQIRASIADKLKLAREAVFSVSALRKESIRRRRKAVDDLNAASSLHRVLEKKLDEACEAEDFETAEMVSENLASAEKEKDRLVILLRDAEMYCDVVDTKMHEALESLIQAEEECVYLLRRFSEEAASNADTVLMNAEAASSKDNAEWISSVEAIEVSKFELEIQCQLVQESKSVLNGLIDHSVEDDRMEIDVLCKRKDLLTEELRILLALVKEKEAEIAENDALIQKVGNRIHEAVSCFKEVQASVDNNYDKLQSRLSELMVENEALQRRKKDIDNYLSQEESKGEKIRNLSIISADEASMYEEAVGLRKSLASLISESMAYRVSLAKREQTVSEEVQILKQETFAATSSLQVIGTWDDHDYGLNDAGKEFEAKITNQRLLLDFLDEPLESTRRKQAGVYASYVFGPVGKQVKVILLDTRYHRDPLSSDGSLLGDAQWTWLEKELKGPLTTITVIVSSIQVISNHSATTGPLFYMESWGRFPGERSRLFKLISDSKREGVFFISGDVHFGEIARYNCAAGYPLYDITASGLTQAVEKAVTPALGFVVRFLAWLTPAIMRVKDKSCRYRSCTYGQPNFGTIEINWDSDPVGLKFDVRDEKGLSVIALNFSLLELKGQEVHSHMTAGSGQFKRYCSLEVDITWFVRYRLAMFSFSTLAVLLLAIIGLLCAVRSCYKKCLCKYKHD